MNRLFPWLSSHNVKSSSQFAGADSHKPAYFKREKDNGK